MSICSYCNEDKTLTREHLIPSWYLKINKSPEDIRFLERNPDRFLHSDITIKDVCAECNNLHLSKLDGYGKVLYESYFATPICDGESVVFKYDYDIFVKWLLKISYNSARIHQTDLEILKDYAQILISEESLPKDFFVYCNTIAPSYEDDENVSQITPKNCSKKTTQPEWFRIGTFRVPKFDSIDWVFRHVSINSYAFFIFIPRINSKKAAAEKDKILYAMKSVDYYGILLNKEISETKLNIPILDCNKVICSQTAQFPVSYGLIEDDVTKLFIKKQSDRLVFAIDRSYVETCNVQEILPLLEYMMSCREIAMAYMQKVEFSIDGYNDDHRELFQIKEVVKFLKLLNDQFPFWMFFQAENGHWLKILMLCLCDGKLISEGEVEYDQKNSQKLVRRWFVKLNELCHKHAIGETINRKISSDVKSVIFGSQSDQQEIKEN